MPAGRGRQGDLHVQSAIWPGASLGVAAMRMGDRGHDGQAEARAGPDGGLDVQVTLPAAANGHRQAAPAGQGTADS